MANIFGTKQNNEGDNRKSVTTRVYQFKNKDGFDPSTLQVSGWDEMLSLRINPTLPPDKQSKEQVFDYDKFVATSLNMEKAMLLIYKIEKDINPAIEAGEEKNVGISVGGDSLIVIGTGKALTNEIKPYLAIHKGLNPDTKIAEQSIYYEFRKSMTIDDYNAENGSYTVEEGYNAEFILFCELLKSFIQNSNFNNHNNRFGNRFSNDRTINTLNSIAEKVGADTGSRYNTNGFNKRNNVFSSSNSSTNYGSNNTTSRDNSKNVTVTPGTKLVGTANNPIIIKRGETV